MWRPLNWVAYLLMTATKLAKSEAIIIIILLRIKEQLINYAIQHGTTTAVISSLPASYMWTTVDSNIAKHCIWQNVCGGKLSWLSQFFTQSWIFSCEISTANNNFSLKMQKISPWMFSCIYCTHFSYSYLAS